MHEAVTRSRSRGGSFGRAPVSSVLIFAGEPDVSTFRLSFATADVAKIEEGLGRLWKTL